MNSARTRVWRFLPKYGKEKSLFNWFFHFAKIERGRSKTKCWQKRKTQNVIWTEILVTDRYTTVIKMCQNSLFFVYFPPFLNTMTNIVQNLTLTGRSINGVLGIRTQDRKLVGATNPLGYGGPPKTNNGLTIKPFWLVHQKFQPIGVRLGQPT